MSLIIRPFQVEDQVAVRDLVLQIQNVEFGLGFEPEEQPDLLDTRKYFRDGQFWVAIIKEEIVGTIGLQPLTKEIAILKKMFVKKAHRGTIDKVAQRLLDIFITTAKTDNFQEIILDTPSVTKGAHRFYEKNGFVEITLHEIPQHFEYPDRNSKFYRRSLLKD